MQNVRMSVEGTTLTITVDLTQNFGPSSSGKTIIIGTSQGNAKLTAEADEITAKVPDLNYGAIQVGLNVFKKA